MWGAVAGAGAGALGAVGSFIGGMQQQKLQKEQLEYQKWLNQQMMNREDNAMQRQANDLKLAGINPLLAGGMGGAEAKGGQATQVGADSPLGTGIANGAGLALQGLQKQMEQATIDKTRAETENIKANNPNIVKQGLQLDEQLAQIKSQTKNNRYEGIGKIDDRVGGLVDIEMSKLGLNGDAGFHAFGIRAGAGAKSEMEKKIRDLTYDLSEAYYDGRMDGTQLREAIVERLNDVKDDAELKTITQRKEERKKPKQGNHGYGTGGAGA